MQRTIFLFFNIVIKKRRATDPLEHITSPDNTIYYETERQTGQQRQHLVFDIFQFHFSNVV